MGGYCGEGEPAVLSREKRARVPKHGDRLKCGDCDTEIQPGQYATVGTAFWWEGGFGSWVVCDPCRAVFKYLWDDGAECLHYGQLRDYVRELAPHDFLPGGELEECPRRPWMDTWLNKWVDDMADNPADDETPDLFERGPAEPKP